MTIIVRPFSPSNPPHCGQRVVNPHDPRHVGTVQAVVASVLVKVKWDSGFLSWMPVASVERAPIESD